jgi:hypothetical protein
MSPFVIRLILNFEGQAEHIADDDVIAELKTI